MDADLTIHLGLIETESAVLKFDLAVSSTGIAFVQVFGADRRRTSHAIFMQFGEQQLAALKNIVHKTDGALEEIALRDARLAP